MEQMKTQSKFQREKPLFRDKPEYKCIGYARQSTNKQISIGAQVEELKKAGCVVVFQETVSSADKARPQFEAALGTLEVGDEIVFTKLDRGFRNQRQCINTLHDLQEHGIHVRTTDGMINTRALGKFAPIVIGLLSGLGEVERQMVIERTQESINHTSIHCLHYFCPRAHTSFTTSCSTIILLMVDKASPVCFLIDL